MVEQLEGRTLLSGVLPASVHASTDAVYTVSGNASSTTVTLSQGVFSFEATKAKPTGRA
ncbi:MAG: hypothetical protein JWN24_4141 [Phycisphaerales bacterium]|nr:hypothetical protein [Phycisphaerales bacterium]